MNVATEVFLHIFTHNAANTCTFQFCTATSLQARTLGGSGVRTNRPLSCRGPQGVHACVWHGALPHCMAVASGRAVVGFKLGRLLFRRLNMHMNPYVIRP